MRQITHWIDGRSENSVREQTQVIDPRSGRPVAQVALGISEDVDRAVAVAESVQPAWSALAPHERGKLLLGIASALRAQRDEFIQRECEETGKLAGAAAAEIDDSASYFEYYAGIVRALFGETIDLGADQRVLTSREPFGVIGMITPWNAPLLQASRGVAPALAVGNAVVLKPSEFTSSTTVMLAELATRIGLPNGILNVVTGDGPTVGAQLAGHLGVRKVVFTGSVVTGKIVAQLAASHLVPVTLELGGKSPQVVFADADLDAAAAQSSGVAANAGQICSALTRLLVERPVYEEMIERVTARLGQLRHGETLAPLTTEAQYRRVAGYFAAAEEENATCRLGGVVASVATPESGYYVEPTVYTDVTPDMRIFQEEIFGPVLCVTAFESETEAVQLANDTSYGLAASVWTGDGARALRVARALRAGQVSVNGGRAGIETPFGGYGESGIGREKGFEALRDYTQLKTTIIAVGAALC